MKYFCTLFITIFCISIAQSQSVGIGTNTPEASAQLDVSSTTKGFLPPRMDSTARNAIVAPATGLTIYNTSINAVQVYNGSKWYATVHFIGEAYGGGVVFYVYDNGQHGLIAATADQSADIRWSASSTNTRAKADGVGAGAKNSLLVITNQTAVDANPFAATVCSDYAVTVGGVTYGDWYLPSKYELNLLFVQRTIIGIYTSYYWSSTEANSAGTTAFSIDFSSGAQVMDIKSFNNHIRAVRAF